MRKGSAFATWLQEPHFPSVQVPELILQPGGPVPSFEIPHNHPPQGGSGSTGYEPNLNLTGAVTGQKPPPPLSGRSNPYGPIQRRVPLTPPAMAGGIPVPEDDEWTEYPHSYD
eukprot:1807854-Amphidinium_carterae.2